VFSTAFMFDRAVSICRLFPGRCTRWLRRALAETGLKKLAGIRCGPSHPLRIPVCFFASLSNHATSKP